MSEIWIRVNQELVAKSIGELVFEEIISSEKNQVSLKSGVIYTFQGMKTIWGHLRIHPSTLKRNGETVQSAAQFFLDSQYETAMSDTTMGNFFEEMHNTLFADMALHQKSSHTSLSELASSTGETIEAHLQGHPKILLNKGRIGWNLEDQELYAPEAQKPFRLHWIALRKNLLQGKYDQKLLDESFDLDSKEKFLKLIPHKDFAFLPVHPWQWKKYISLQFRGLISKGDLVSLGEWGDHYVPQISLRTLMNVDRPGKKDIKLPLSILNTSCVRGLTAKTIELGSAVSEILETICKNDSVLKNVEILKESNGVAFIHPDFASVKEAPYRYHEFLGTVWRESPKSKINANEKAILTSALFHQDISKKSLFKEILSLSGLSASEWLNQYFEVVVIPLYHLQVKYGVGMVAHGQNIVLKMRNNIPVGMFLKDFQGDLRLSSEMPEAGKIHFASIEEEMTKLPPHYLIHDLVTGHFITVLRFLSGVLEESGIIAEKEFYATLAASIKNYMKGKVIPESQNLLKHRIERVLLNKVRFKIGYSDTTERPLPLTGSPLSNPLAGENL